MLMRFISYPNKFYHLKHCSPFQRCFYKMQNQPSNEQKVTIYVIFFSTKKKSSYLEIFGEDLTEKARQG